MAEDSEKDRRLPVYMPASVVEVFKSLCALERRSMGAVCTEMVQNWIESKQRERKGAKSR